MMAECDPIIYPDHSASSADPSFTTTGMIVCRDIRLVHTFVLDELRSGFTARQWSCGKVIFSVISVRQSVIWSRRGWGPMWPLPLPLQEPSSAHGTSLYRTPQYQSQSHPFLVVTSGGQDWRPVQACLLEDPPPTSADIWWLLKSVWSAQAGGTHPIGMLSCYLLRPSARSIHHTLCTPANNNSLDMTLFPY